MTTINLRDYYPFYHEDVYVEVTDETAQTLLAFNRQEKAYRRKVFRYKAHISLDRSNGTEHDIMYVSISPEEIYERKMTNEQLHAAMATLPDKQAKRIYAHFYLNMSQSDIARSEGVSKETVSESIGRGLKKIGLFCKHLKS